MTTKSNLEVTPGIQTQSGFYEMCVDLTKRWHSQVLISGCQLKHIIGKEPMAHGVGEMESREFDE